MPKKKQPGFNQEKGMNLQPSGTLVNGLFDKIQKPLKIAAENVFEEIKKIHGFPTLGKIDLVQVNSANFDGEFEYYKLGRGVRIKISSRAVNKEFTLLHEIGHLIDNQALGIK